jgi:hypothetical protein
MKLFLINFNQPFSNCSEDLILVYSTRNYRCYITSFFKLITTDAVIRLPIKSTVSLLQELYCIIGVNHNN